MKKQWCIPPKNNAAFVWKMEDVPEVYQRPYDSRRPQVCLDEASKQLIGETRGAIPAAPGREAREDYVTEIYSEPIEEKRQRVF